MEQKCSKCGLLQPLEYFHSRGGGKKHKQCKICKRKAIEKNYKENKPIYIARAIAHNQTAKQILIDTVNEMKNVPCADCGQKFPPCVMDFDHRPGEKKVNSVSKLVGSLCSGQALEECKKCDIVCANCHRIRTHITRKIPRTDLY